MTVPPRHVKSLWDLGDDMLPLLDRAALLKTARNAGNAGNAGAKKSLSGKTVVLLLEKASTRTRLSFEVGIHELGGNAITMVARDSQLGRGEPLADTARMLSAYAHAVVFRTHGHERVETLAAHATIPVVNGLSDAVHPCQLLADLQTVRESFADLAGVRVAWIGDGNNMAHSWINAAAMLGFDLTLACPDGYEPNAALLSNARKQARGNIERVRHAAEAVEGAHVVSTDVWASMGQEQEAAARLAAFASFQVDRALMARARPEAIFLHCLPAHRGEEVAADVIEGPQSRVWDEAENRLHSQKALLEWCLRVTPTP